jgi:hypothetical protein
MNADAIKTLTTDALDKLAALLDEGHSERLTALFKTIAVQSIPAQHLLDRSTVMPLACWLPDLALP